MVIFELTDPSAGSFVGGDENVTVTTDAEGSATVELQAEEEGTTNTTAGSAGTAWKHR
jgi:hypothetical protein